MIHNNVWVMVARGAGRELWAARPPGLSLCSELCAASALGAGLARRASKPVLVLGPRGTREEGKQWETALLAIGSRRLGHPWV